ncbi:hypothetical protein [Desulfotalea psychrophila]|uniref:Uncharacterized protein n=1 Tax=Desulfotalea psychrophila (strain LSv54 / DSM 12343) TaxID=177439 RepID=Q6AJN8_DESPS|nr:hypothetical protein [Desulfotalea psychrophila]CAG37442.1 conserved hypothetical protein [Desulfotalea psychrophila LSv54]
MLGTIHRRSLLISLLLILLCSAPALAGNFLFSKDQVGEIGPQTGRSDLIRIYGEEAVKDTPISLGEGMYETGTEVLFADSGDSVEILWQDQGQTAPARLTLNGRLWRSVHGIAMGSSLQEIEELNGRPFKLAGFGWDYGGTVLSWKSGLLEQAFGGTANRVIIRLRATGDRDGEDYRQIMGDGGFSSDNKYMQRLNPQVYQIMVEFN